MPLLAFADVSKTYWRGRHELVVLDRVTFEVEAGELAAVFGQRASGKTTLLRIAAGLEAPDAGTVRFAGEDLSPRTRPPRLHGLHPQIGWVRRGGPLVGSMSMLDYVALPLLRSVAHGEARRRATKALRQVHAADLGAAAWGELSEGERAAVTIAQAIVREPPLLLVDDPTMGLDTREREVVLTLLREIADRSGAGVLMAVPEVPDMLRAHRVMSLGDGELMQPTRRAPGEIIDFPRSRDGTA